ncbi:hypothetical protein [uncultured Brevundimonas sp.]|uniref:hypothetical protein n=1 Tax=uncultured Brevundimonas sp. TaxID=213418 RepID=UPI00259A52DF|nr:hypothetical protein [uncultured Brevundimonas sp.]
MRARIISTLIATFLIAGCGRTEGENTPLDARPEKSEQPSASGAPTAVSSRNQPAQAPKPNCDDYRADLTDGDIVRIYYGAAGLTPPLEQWAEDQLRHIEGVEAEEAWRRATDRANAQWNALKDLRCIVIRANANVGGYDEARGALAVGALNPDSYYTFNDGGERVQIRFRNADSVRFWPMAREHAHALTANYGMSGATAIIRTKIISARPSGRGGVIEAEVVDYDIQSDRGDGFHETVRATSG